MASKFIILDKSTCIKGHPKLLILSECRPGFHGVNCLQTCGENFYGNLSENKYDCNETQICHHACGCLQNVTITAQYQRT